MNPRRISLPLLCLFLSACEPRPQSNLPVVDMKIGRRLFRLEIADTPATMEKGLMQRDSMPSDHGMIFVFPRESMQAFWMKNTRIPLDILFLDTSGKVVSIHQMQPYDENTTSSDFPARFAIELNQGAAAKAEVKVGDTIILPTAKPTP
jgi:uncharacterized protein